MKSKLLVFSITILLAMGFLTVLPSVSAVENTPPTFKTAWEEVAGKLGDGRYIYSLIVYNGGLYGGSLNHGELFKWNDVDDWIEVAPQLGSETRFYSTIVYNNNLYAGTSPNGKLYKWNDVDNWVEVAPQLGGETEISSLTVYNGNLYGGTTPNGKLYKWNDVDSWVEVALQLGGDMYINSLANYNGSLYGGTGVDGKLYKWNDVDSWVEVAGKLGDEYVINSLVIYNDGLYGGTAPNGKLYKWNDVDTWIEVAPKLGDETEIFSLAVYNGGLYGGTYPNGKLLKWNDVDSWVEVAGHFGDTGHIYSLIVYNDDLYGVGDSFLKLSKDILPYNNQQNIDVNTILKIGVIDNDNDIMSVSFYWNDDTLIETVTDVSTNTYAETSSLSLDSFTEYSWYAIVDDSYSQIQSDDFTFLTHEYRFYHISESFSDLWMPTDWQQVVYSGIGYWENNTVDISPKQPDNSIPPFAIADSDTHNTLIFDVGLFTPKINLISISNSLYLECEIFFYPYLTDEGFIRVWSTNKTILEETLEHFNIGTKSHITHKLNTINYSNTNDIQIEFYYTNNNEPYQFYFSVDNVMVYETIPEIPILPLTPTLNIYTCLTTILILIFGIGIYVMTRKKRR